MFFVCLGEIFTEDRWLKILEGSYENQTNFFIAFYLIIL